MSVVAERAPVKAPRKNGRKEKGEGLRDSVLQLTIQPPNLKTLPLTIRGTAPLVINAFSEEARAEMLAKHIAGDTAKSKKARKPKDPKKNYEGCKHYSREGWLGIPAPAFRAGMVDACRTAGFVMTRAKLALFIEPDGFDKLDGTPLVKITKGVPRMVEHAVRNDGGKPDLRHRPMWDPNWEAVVRVQFDADMLQAGDVVNLLARVGKQVGICAGRPFSRDSCGQGWGLFAVVGSQ